MITRASLLIYRQALFPKFFCQSLAWLGFVALAACQSQPESTQAPPPPPPPNIYSLIFIDKSISFDISSDYAQSKYKKILQQIVQDNVQQNGDRVEVYYIHENTAQAKVFSAQCKLQAPDTIGLNKTDLAAAKSNYAFALKKEKMKLINRSLKALEEDNTHETNKQTDIWGSLGIIDKRKAKLKDNTLLKVYYFSDMVESSKGAGRRDFHLLPPFSRAQAEQWAQEDAKRFKDMEIEETEIHYILPYSPLSSTNRNNPFVITYWERLFDLLGIEELTELNAD
jgi:hypothetical protein